jgi:hypothetical protein
MRRRISKNKKDRGFAQAKPCFENTDHPGRIRPWNTDHPGRNRTCFADHPGRNRPGNTDQPGRIFRPTGEEIFSNTDQPGRIFRPTGEENRRNSLRALGDFYPILLNLAS